MKGEPFELFDSTVGLYRDGTSDLEPNQSGKPRRIDGLIVGAPVMTRNAPHGGAPSRSPRAESDPAPDAWSRGCPQTSLILSGPTSSMIGSDIRNKGAPDG